MMLRFDFPSVFEDLIENEVKTGFASASRTYPAMDISENDNEYVVIGEVPGVRKQDVKITYENNILTVQAKRKSGDVSPDAKVVLTEIRVRDFSRSIRIPVDIDAEKITAELENGILRVVLPKAQSARVRTITLK